MEPAKKTKEIIYHIAEVRYALKPVDKIKLTFPRSPALPSRIKLEVLD